MFGHFNFKPIWPLYSGATLCYECKCCQVAVVVPTKNIDFCGVYEVKSGLIYVIVKDCIEFDCKCETGNKLVLLITLF